MNPAGSTFCQLCGAPLGEKGESVEGSDTEVYRELAQTNLLRMRGEYKDAAHVCLSILKRYPHNVTAHALLGDIYAEQGDLEQAAEWYEMALDLSPQAEAERQKLDAIRAKINERQNAATDVQLEIPATKPPKTGLLIGLMGGGIVIIGIVAYLMGTAWRNQKAKDDSRQDPIVVTTTGGESGATTGAMPINEENDPGANVTPKSTDDKILELLKDSGAQKARYVSVLEDSRNPTLIVTVSATVEEDLQTVAVQTAEDVFATLAKYVSITIRVLIDGKVTFVADAARERLDEVKKSLAEGDTLTARWEEILTDVRRAGEADPVTPPAETTGGTTGGTTGEAPSTTETTGGEGTSGTPNVDGATD